MHLASVVGMIHDIAGHEDLTDKIIECGIKVHEHFGPGLLESVYKPCLALELREAGLKVDTTRRVALVYKTMNLDAFYCPDIVVNDAVIVELKTVEMVTSVHIAQVITYLKLMNLPVGLLMNFKVPLLNRGVRRVVRPDLYRRPPAKDA
jgi:GxxExxY protein